MEGRWLSLAVNAHIQKALDYGQVTRHHPPSLLQEVLVFRALERRLEGSFILSKALFGSHRELEGLAGKQNMSLRGPEVDYFEVLFPWQKEAFEKQVGGQFSGNVAKMRELYRQAQEQNG